MCELLGRGEAGWRNDGVSITTRSTLRGRDFLILR